MYFHIICFVSNYLHINIHPINDYTNLCIEGQHKLNVLKFYEPFLNFEYKTKIMPEIVNKSLLKRLFAYFVVKYIHLFV